MKTIVLVVMDGVGGRSYRFLLQIIKVLCSNMGK